jgi:hypothetical protein
MWTHKPIRCPTASIKVQASCLIFSWVSCEVPVPCFWLKVATSSGVKYARCLRIFELKFVVADVEPKVDGGNAPFVPSFDRFEELSISMEVVGSKTG